MQPAITCVQAGRFCVQHMEKSEAEKMLGFLWLIVTGLSHTTSNGKWFLYEMLFAEEKGSKGRDEATPQLQHPNSGEYSKKNEHTK